MSLAPPRATHGLDRFVDNVVGAASFIPDWTAAAQILAPHQPVMSGDPFGRLFKSDFGARAVAAIGNESKSLGAVGVLAANVLGTLLAETGGSQVLGQSVPADARKLVVYHGQNGLRTSILILDPHVAETVPAKLAPVAWTENLARQARQLFVRSSIATVLPNVTPDDAIEALWIARPRVIIAPEPPMIDTSVRRPAGAAICGSKTSAVGAYARDSSGVPGLTVCYHGTGGVGTEVSIDHVTRTIALASQVLDTCFVPIGEQDVPLPPPALYGVRGLLANRAPGAQEHHTYWSQAGNTLMEARITATDFGLPQPTPQRQLCIYTDAVTNYGDSGGALVNDDDQLVGFAFQRTPFDRQLQYSTWIWAAAAFAELGLKPL